MTRLLDGRLVLRQPPPGAGYRVNVDAIHLARFAAGRIRGTLVDLGAGTGAVGLAAALAEANAVANGVTAEVVRSDVAGAAATLKACADVVVCNPPYFEPGRARPRAVAPEARVGSLEHFVGVARTMLGPRGRFFFVYPAPELVRALSILEKRGLVAKRVQMVHGKPTRPARIVLVESCAGKPGGLVVEPAIVG